MRPLDDKECYGYSSNGVRAVRKPQQQQASRAKPTPSKWDDAQKWLVGGRAAADGVHHTKHRNSNADDRRLLSSSSQNGRVSCSSVDGALEYHSMVPPPPRMLLMGEGDDAGETKKIDYCVHGSPVAAVILRDMGTEMTPIASKEPSRTATPLRASTPVARSPISSRSSTPVRRRPEGSAGVVVGTTEVPVVAAAVANVSCGDEGALAVVSRATNTNTLESRAAAWDEAERAKFTARYKREEVKIQAWENHEKRKAQTEMKKVQMKADQMRARAQEKLANRLAATQRMAEAKRANAEAKLNERAARTSEKANYIRRTGHLPSSFFNFKMTCLCG